MKKNISLFLVFVLVLGFIMVSPASVNATKDIKVLIEGEEIEFDVAPQIVEDRTLLPLRVIFENLGLTVGWDGETKTVTGTNQDTEIILKIDSVDATVNGVKQILDVPAKLINDRTMVPVRFIAESLDMYVGWDGKNRTVKISETVSSREAIRIVEDKTGYQYGAEYDATTGEYDPQPELIEIFGTSCWLIPVINPNTSNHAGELYVDWKTGIIYTMVGEIYDLVK